MQKHKSATEEEEYIRRQRQLDEDADFAILNNLEFATMGERREEIHEAHKTTFSWIFRDPDAAVPSGNVGNTGRPWTNFAHWLRQGEEIYWINGKAGSGKSTLMRYIRETPDTLKHLREWAGSAELRVASFYFWNGGSLAQRSQAGLFRSLLYEILRMRQDLIRHVFEKEWLGYRSSEHKPWTCRHDGPNTRDFMRSRD
jgi:ATPase subunit of ABC transporter with duplicated ATPase domains